MTSFIQTPDCLFDRLLRNCTIRLTKNVLERTHSPEGRF